MSENVSHRFDRLPGTEAERDVESRPTREAIVDFWVDRFGVDPEAFEAYTFWERGNGKIWAFADDLETPVDIEALGMSFMRTRQEHWKPTTEAVQRFGAQATRSVIHLDSGAAERFLAGEDQQREWDGDCGAAERFLAGEDQQREWDGDWGYLIVTHDIAGEPEPIGVGLYVHGELRSQIPKGRRREFGGE